MNWFQRILARKEKRLQGLPEMTVEELRLSKERGLEMQLRHPIFAKLADELAAAFDEMGGVNYIEFTAYSEKHGPMVVTIRRQEGETPAQQNERLRARIKELEDGKNN